MVNIYGITSSALLPLSGGLSEVRVYSLNILDRVVQILATKAFGRRPVIIVSVTLYAIGSAVSGAAHNLNMLIVARGMSASWRLHWTSLNVLAS